MGRFRVWIVVILVASAGLITAVWLLHPRSMLLFDHATKVAKDDDYDPSGFYWWLSNHQVVLTRSVNDELRSLMCHDTNTGKDDPCVPLNHLIHTQKAGPRIDALSPDRRVLLLGGENDRQIGVTQDGRLLFVDRQTATTPTTAPSAESYMADGSLWIEPILAWNSDFHIGKNDGIARLLIHDGVRHTIVKTVEFNPWLAQGFEGTITNRNHFLMQKPSVYGTFGWVSNSNACLKTIDIDLNADEPKPQTITVNLSVGSDPYEVCYSPDGERVAFLRDHDNHLDGWFPPLLQGWRDRLFPHDTRPRFKVSLWVSDIRGQRMHEVGSVPHGNNFPRDSNYPSSVQWLPDGKTLSFLAHGSVWTVPAD